MIRQGKYTKPVSRFTEVKQSVRQRWTWFKGLSKKKKTMIIAGPILLFLVLTPPLTYLYFARDIADADRLMNRNNTGVVLLDRDGEVIYSYGTAERGKRVPLDRIADSAEKALISAEDKSFYEHSGFSFKSILAAMYANVANQDATAYGGSTITQQLAKNTLLSSSQTFLRKYQELSVAIAIEQQYTKDEILELYLNSVYFGEGAFGIDSAAEKYFGKSAADLSLAESSMLVGLLPAPSAYSPITGDRELAKKQQEIVLSRMVQNKAITEDEKSAAVKQELAYAEAEAEEDNKAPHFAQMVLEELYKKYGEERITRSGYKVYTTLSLKQQQAAQDAINDQMDYIRRNGGSNASLVAMDPRSGEVIALLGSADWNNEKFGKVNMAITPRQPGSSFKPIYFTQALQDGVITPSTVLRDESTTFPGGYKPENYDFRYRGNINVRNALGQSLNIPAVKVMQKLGVDKSVETAQRLGLSTIDDADKYGLSLALGAAEVRLVDMANAYAAFADRGSQHTVTTIRSIDDKFSKSIFKNRTTYKKVMNDSATYLISKILSDNEARAPSFGSSLNIAEYDVAVKTGTTDDSRDAWIMGYTPNVTVGVWVGNNDNEVMQLGGSSMAGPIWKTTMRNILKDNPKLSFVQPSSVTSLLVCKSNGLAASRAGAGVYTEYFIKGKTPSGTCDVPVEKKEKAKPKEPEESEGRQERPEDGAGDTPPPPPPAQPTSPPPTTQPGTDSGSEPAAEPGAGAPPSGSSPSEPAPTTPQGGRGGSGDPAGRPSDSGPPPQEQG